MVILKMGLELETDAIINSIIGGLLLLLLNMFNFDIGVNPWNALVIGIFGIPGLILLIVLKLILAV